MAGFLVFLVAIILGRYIGIKLGSRPNYILGLCAAFAGIAAFITGAISFFKFRDRSFVVLLATVLGSFVTLIFIIEVVEGIIWRSTH